MTRPADRRPWRALLAVLALALAACGGGDDDAATADGTATVAAADGNSAGGDGSDGDGEGGTDAGEPAVGQGGPVRALPGLAEHADLPLDAFLQEVLGFPAAAPVPDLELARAYTQASALGNSTASVTYGADYIAPEGTVEEVFAVVEEAIDPATWTASSEIEETNPGYHGRSWTATADGVATARVIFQEEGNEVVVTVGSGNGVEADPPAALWPWAGDVPVAPGTRLVSWLVQVPNATGGPAALLDMRWRGEVGAHDALVAFVSALPAGALTPGEVTTETEPFTETEVAVTADGGFTGSLSAVLTQPDREPDVILVGNVPLE